MANSSPRPPSAPLFGSLGLTPALAGGFGGGPAGPRFPDFAGLPGLGARGGRRGGDAAGFVSGTGRAPEVPARPVGLRPGAAPPAPAPQRPAGPTTGGHPRPAHRDVPGAVPREETLRELPREHRGPGGPGDPRDHRAPRPQQGAPRRRDLDPGRPPRPAPPVGRGPSPLRGRLAVAAVAAGALATAGHSLAGMDALSEAPTTAELALASDRATTSDATSSRAAGLDAATSGVLPVAAPAATTSTGSAGSASADEGHQVGSLSKAADRAAAAARAAAEAARPDYVKPAEGRFTSGFGARWGSSHRGIDIAGPIGTPIVSVADGTVVESGPASGFGMWVKVELDDGTINVYGHVNRSYVEEGQRVRAGEEIAEIGNRGRSTGPHLHFEVWEDGSRKINPLPWLAERGISLGSPQD
ncbi:M23 family metallopeptidase [Actinomycetospora lemnae]|uniref:M23 family metallopeptidase n=1 Tax=Actinomycetospora lemnae TaxID=3019891 RepID=A0ABT5SUV5_9PSEU|nr:M23 family metallopeptidase [Actinomycetospora sp. DW7H6]MDD7966644.1 M23 family metallopeptidase [Actinomycetospora sp. DW7H6]